VRQDSTKNVVPQGAGKSQRRKQGAKRTAVCGRQKSRPEGGIASPRWRPSRTVQVAGVMFCS
jgi:hypothetical protein